MPITLPVGSPQTARVVDTDRLYEHNLVAKKTCGSFLSIPIKTKGPFSQIFDTQDMKIRDGKKKHRYKPSSLSSHIRFQRSMMLSHIALNKRVHIFFLFVV